MERIEIVEVGPRDGIQGIGPFIPTAVKIDYLRRLVAAGLGRIEIGSFVSPAAVPQLRDTPELLAASAAMPGLDPQVLVPSERRGATRSRPAPGTSPSFCRCRKPTTAATSAGRRRSRPPNTSG
jgi:isopropylmalate/homocitrate/citramalate synthase